MNSIIDLVLGAIQVRIKILKTKVTDKPDADFVLGGLAIGSRPTSKAILKSGFSAIMSLMDIGEGSQINLIDVKFTNIPIKNKTAPSIKQMEEGVRWVDSMINQGKRVLIHCNLGRGRSALMVCAYLVTKEYDMVSAIELVKKRRSCIFLNQKQQSILAEFCKGYSK
mgnify:CR=1 FL=1